MIHADQFLLKPQFFSYTAHKNIEINPKEFPPNMNENQQDKSSALQSNRINFVDDDMSGERSREKNGYSSGRWTKEEHQIFLFCLHQYGREWKKIAEKIPTRTPAQIRSHAQKYLTKLSKKGQVLSGTPIEIIGSKHKPKRPKISSSALGKII